jgi:hypothetical protein
VSFPAFVVAVHGALSGAGLSHAFGGALALAYVAEARGTVDIDVNVFTPTDGLGAVLGGLAPLGLRPEHPPDQALPAAGIRLRPGQDGYPVDLFLSLDERYAEIERRCVSHPFGPDRVPLPFLSAEDLAVFKLSFGRDKDWVDLRAIATHCPRLDDGYVERQLVGLRGPGMHPRVARLRRLLREVRAGGAPRGADPQAMI